MAAWNGNDLARYLATYVRSPQPELADGAATVRGWQPVYEYYKKNFAGEGGLGTLAFSGLHIDGAADGTASVSGRCKLTRADGDGRAGDFAMQMRRFADGWKVVRVSVPGQQLWHALSPARDDLH